MTSQQPISQNQAAVNIGASPSAQPTREARAVDGVAFKAVLERLELAAQDLSRRSESLSDAKDLSGAVADAASSLGDALALRDSVLEAYRGAQQASKPDGEDAA